MAPRPTCTAHRHSPALPTAMAQYLHLCCFTPASFVLNAQPLNQLAQTVAPGLFVTHAIISLHFLSWNLCHLWPRTSSWVQHLHTEFSIHLISPCWSLPSSSDFPTPPTPTTCRQGTSPREEEVQNPPKEHTGTHRPSLRGWDVAAWLETAGKSGCLSHTFRGACTQAEGSRFTRPKAPHSHFPHIPSLSTSDPIKVQSQKREEPGSLPKSLAYS